MLRDFLRISLVTILLIGAGGCKDKDDQVPYVYVDITLLLDLPAYSPLASPSGSVEITGGSLGIIVYRRNVNEFVAFERHCTYNVSEYCRVHIDEETNITAVCECCGSIFSIYDGTPIEGAAARSLVEYRTGYNGNTNQLRIFN